MAVRPTKVLTVNEVRDHIKELREAALHRGAEVHFGERGRDEVTLIASASLAKLKAQAAGVPPSPVVQGARRRRALRQREFIKAILAAGPIEGPPDWSEHLDAYLRGDKAFPKA